jgi:hypothetical protein
MRGARHVRRVHLNLGKVDVGRSGHGQAANAGDTARVPDHRRAGQIDGSGETLEDSGRTGMMR